MSDTAFEGWAVLELMGHRRIAGKLTEVTGGCFAGLLRIDVPGPDGKMVATQFYSSSAVFGPAPDDYAHPEDDDEDEDEDEDEDDEGEDGLGG